MIQTQVLLFFFKGNYTLRIDMTDFMDEQRFAQYENFQVADEQVTY